MNLTEGEGWPPDDLDSFGNDGTVPVGREVQIKMTQGDRIEINDKLDSLLVLQMNRDIGELTEIYNGPGKRPWDLAHLKNTK